MKQTDLQKWVLKLPAIFPFQKTFLALLSSPISSPSLLSRPVWLHCFTQHRTGPVALLRDVRSFIFLFPTLFTKFPFFQASFESNTENTYTAGSLHKLQGCARPKPGVENPSEYPTKQ